MSSLSDKYCKNDGESYEALEKAKPISLMNPFFVMEQYLRLKHNCPDKYSQRQPGPESYGSKCIEVLSDLIVDFKNVEVGPMYLAPKGMVVSYNNKCVDLDKDKMVGYCLKILPESIYMEYIHEE